MKRLKYSLLIALLFFKLGVFSQSTYKAPELTDRNSWSLVLLPDPQGYTKFKRNQPLLDLMMNWIEANKKKLNIQLVMCTGDLVEQNFVAKSDSINGDQPSSSQWKSISDAFGTLDNKVPYILCTGNHDYGTNYTENRYSQFNSFFPPDKNPLTKALLVDMAPNASGVRTMENACYEFVTPYGRKMLIFSLEYVPRKSVVEWAKKISALPKYAHHLGIILTHSYMRSMVKHNERIEKEEYPPRFTDTTVGQKLWDELINPSANIQLVFCGHVVDVASHQGHVGFRQDINASGIIVKQMLFNAQNEGGNWQGNGGNCWLRILEFLPDKKTVLVKTFSPLFGLSPETSNLAWRKESFDEFSFIIQPLQNSLVIKDKPNDIFLTEYSIPIGLKGAEIGVVKSLSGSKKASIENDSSGLFTISRDNVLKLKNNKSLNKENAIKYAIAVKSGLEMAEFILVKDEFLHNKVVAHRGAWKDNSVPQNSLKALDYAISSGCEGSEFDVWLSSDGIPVVSHDGTIGGVKIEETAAEELQRINIGGNHYVPTLEEFLLTIKGQNRTKLFLEIKSSDKGQERTLQLTEKVVCLIQSMKAQAWINYISFNYDAMKRVLQLDPSSKVSYLWGDRSPDLVKTDNFWGTDYPYEHYKKNPEWIGMARKLGLTVNVWTINDPTEMKELLKQDVDFITTDECNKLLKIIKN